MSDHLKEIISNTGKILYFKNHFNKYVMMPKFLGLHSDLFDPIPENIFYPLSRFAGFSKFDFTEEYLSRIIKKHGKRYGLPNFGGFSDLNITGNDFGTAIEIFNDSFFSDFEGSETKFNSMNLIHSVSIKPEYFLKNDQLFEKDQLNSHIQMLCKLMYKMESDFLMINIPPMDIPTKFIETTPVYYRKFLKKLSHRMFSISKIAANEDIKVLINFNPIITIKHEKSSNTSQLYSPFRDFTDFREFYDSLIESNEDFGLFIDVSSFFITESKKIIEILIKMQNEDLLSEIHSDFDRFLLRRPKISEKIFKSLKKVEFLQGLGLNDVKWIDIISLLYNKHLTPEKFMEQNIEDFIMKLYLSLKQKLLMGKGDLPLNSFLYNIKSLNTTTGDLNYFSLNTPLQTSRFNFDTIDWRTIDINKLKIIDPLRESIKQHLKDKMRIFNKRRKLNKNFDDTEDPITPDQENLNNMKIFSLKEITESIKRYYRFL
ncbi:MAG: hypothetical protein ACTSWY_10180 [Promethearchaeota archaeon]